MVQQLKKLIPRIHKGGLPGNSTARSYLNDRLVYLLGILNSNKPLPEIVDKFKKYGKRYIHDVIDKTRESSESSKEFTASEVQMLNVLCHRLNNLMIGFKPTSDKRETEHIKALIKDFTAGSEKVLKTLSK